MAEVYNKAVYTRLIPRKVDALQRSYQCLLFSITTSVLCDCCFISTRHFFQLLCVIVNQRDHQILKIIDLFQYFLICSFHHLLSLLCPGTSYINSAHLSDLNHYNTIIFCHIMVCRLPLSFTYYQLILSPIFNWDLRSVTRPSQN